MNVQQFIEQSKCECLSEHNHHLKEIKGCFCSDLLSWVMGNCKNNQAWITVQSHLNVIAIAVLCELSCVILAHGVEVDEEVIKKANEENVTLLRSNLSSFELCRVLIEMGL